MKEENRLWVLIGRKLGGEASEKDLQELQELLQKNPDACYYMEILSVWWNKTECPGSDPAEKAVNKLILRITKESKNPVLEQYKTKTGKLNFLKETLCLKIISKSPGEICSII